MFPDFNALINEVQNFFKDCRDYMQLQLQMRKDADAKHDELLAKIQPFIDIANQAIQGGILGTVPTDAPSAITTEPLPVLDTTQVAALTTQQIEPAVTTAPPVGFIATVEAEVKKVEKEVRAIPGIVKGFFS